MSVIRKADYILLVVLTLIAIAASGYAWAFGLFPEIRNLFRTKPEWLLQTSWYVPVFLVHISLGGIAILSGSTQFFTYKSSKRIGIHRFLGKLYLSAVILSGISGLIVAFYATGNWISKAGFISLAVGWLSSTIIGYFFIRNKKIDKHRNWMIRSYAFCLAFVTFRIYLGLGAASSLKFYDYYSYLSFLSWIPNFLLAEYLIKRIERKVKTATSI